MLPIFTTEQVRNGIDTGDLLIDLSDYIKKKDAATKTDIESLTAVIAGKLDATPQHKHDISNVKDLQEELDSKYDTSKRYPHNTILSDTEKISYLEAPKIELLELVKNKEADGYKFYVDESNGDLMITLDDTLIATYVKSTGNWIFGGINLNEIARNVDTLSIFTASLEASSITAASLEANIKTVAEHDAQIKDNAIDIVSNDSKINALTAKLDEYISKADAVLKNHYDVLIELCQKHDMIDTDTNDGSKITTEESSRPNTD